MIRLLVLDVDGTMTDGGVYYDGAGNEMKKFAIKDGAGLVLAMAPLMGSVETLLWFFTYHLTLVPVGILAPIFLLLGCLIPLGVYRSATRASLVERLRATED